MLLYRDFEQNRSKQMTKVKPSHVDDDIKVTKGHLRNGYKRKRILYLKRTHKRSVQVSVLLVHVLADMFFKYEII